MKTKFSRTFLMLALVAAIVMSVTGGTIAWFTDEVSSESNVIQPGNLDIEVEYTLDGENWESLDGATDLFEDCLWEPGYTRVVALKIENKGSLAAKYKANMNFEDITGTNKEGEDIVLSEYLKVSTLVQQTGAIGDIIVMLAFDGENKVAYENTVDFDASNILRQDIELHPGDGHYMIIKVDMPETVGNEANHNGTDVPSINFGLSVVATQYTFEEDSFDNQYDADAEYPVDVDQWDGTADTSWYNDTDTEFIITTAEQLAGLAELVDGGNTFAGKTVKLANDLDLRFIPEGATEPKSFDPIGYGYDVVFKGTFDGQDHTISNLYQNGWDLGYSYSTAGGGLFASVVDATFKNLTIDNAEIVMECIDMGTLVGYSYGNCTYENITVKNSSLGNYQRYTGGVVGEVNGNQVFKNVDVIDTTVASMWGDFDCSLGGIIGGKWGDAEVYMEDCDVECVLDTNNDVISAYRWYAYRRAGMLIGNSEETVKEGDRTSASASYLTAKNCTVTYGDWVNYRYCEFAGTNYPYVRVEAGLHNGAYSNPRYGNPTDANGNKVVDDNHVHNEGEDHHITLTFDQLFGGGQGVYGTATHDGVTVIYP